MYFFFSGKLWSGAKGAAVFLCGNENGEGEKIYVHKNNEFCRNRNWDFWIIWTPGLAVTQSFFCFRICCEREEKKYLILPNSPFKRALNQKKILSRLVLDIWSLKKKCSVKSISAVTSFFLGCCEQAWPSGPTHCPTLREAPLSWSACPTCLLTECGLKKLTPRTDGNENARQEKLLFLPKHEKRRHKCIPHRLS